MEKKHIITLSGRPGSGKSSTSDKVAELLGYDRFSSGDMVRKMLERRKMTLAEFNAQATDDHTLDHEIDEQLRELRNKSDIIIDSRLGFYWIPESFKVFLDLDMDVASARIFKDTIDNASRSNEASSSASIADVARQVQERVANERNRYRSLYGIDPYNTSHFDLIINTSRHSPQTVALTVFDNYKKWLKSETWEPVHSAVPLGYSHTH